MGREVEGGKGPEEQQQGTSHGPEGGMQGSSRVQGGRPEKMLRRPPRRQQCSSQWAVRRCTQCRRLQARGRRSRRALDRQGQQEDQGVCAGPVVFGTRGRGS